MVEGGEVALRGVEELYQTEEKHSWRCFLRRLALLTLASVSDPTKSAELPWCQRGVALELTLFPGRHTWNLIQ